MCYRANFREDCTSAVLLVFECEKKLGVQFSQDVGVPKPPTDEVLFVRKFTHERHSNHMNLRKSAQQSSNKNEKVICHSLISKQQAIIY